MSGTVKCVCLNISVFQVIYIAPLKAIVRERMNDWRKHLVPQLGKKMVTSFSIFCFVTATSYIEVNGICINVSYLFLFFPIRLK